MSTYEWKDGVLVDTSLKEGLGNLRLPDRDTNPINWGISVNTPYTKAAFADKIKIDTTKIPKLNANSIFGEDGFGWNEGTLKGLGTIGNLASGLGSLYLGSKQMRLAEDAFKFNKDMANKEYAMALEAYNANKARSESIGSQMQAGSVGTK